MISSGVAALDRRAGQRHLAADQRPDDELVPGLEVGVGALAGGDRGEPQDDLPLLRLARRRPVEDRRRVVGDAADRELVEREVVVRLRQRLGGGEDDVGVAGGLVDVDVERDHEVERLDRRLERAGVGRRDQRVAGDRDQRPDLALARGRDLLGEPDDRQLAEDLGPAADPARPAADRDMPLPTGPVPAELRWPTAASGNIAPPSRSRLPVRKLSTSTSQLASVPKRCVVVPIRP